MNISPQRNSRPPLRLATYIIRLRPLLGGFDFVFGSGSLCYLPSLDRVHETVQDLVDLMKEGGRGAFSMIPESVGTKISCQVHIPRRFWDEEAGCGCGYAAGFCDHTLAILRRDPEGDLVGLGTRAAIGHVGEGAARRRPKEGAHGVKRGVIGSSGPRGLDGALTKGARVEGLEDFGCVL